MLIARLDILGSGVTFFEVTNRVITSLTNFCHPVRIHKLHSLLRSFAPLHSHTQLCEPHITISWPLDDSYGMCLCFGCGRSRLWKWQRSISWRSLHRWRTWMKLYVYWIANTEQIINMVCLWNPVLLSRWSSIFCTSQYFFRAYGFFPSNELRQTDKRIMTSWIPKT